MSWSSSSEEEWNVGLAAAQCGIVINGEASHGGSLPGRAANLDRDQHGHAERLHNDYFAASPRYNNEQFRRRWRMSRQVFSNIASALVQHDRYFSQQRDATGKLGLSTEQKLAAAIRALAYDLATDTFDDSLGISESTGHECLERFCNAMVSVFESDWLRPPSVNEQHILMAQNAARGFPGMLGSLDCTHWTWKQCPVAWAGQYAGKEKTPTVVLEAIADQHMYFWHAFFGVAGSNNDLNVLQQSDLLQLGRQTDVPFSVRGCTFPRGYYLTDGIYPDWPTLVSSISHCADERTALFAARQESCRKDIERAFGRLKNTWHILAGRTEIWSVTKMQSVMTTCMIIHNMTIRDQLHASHTACLQAASQARQSPRHGSRVYSVAEIASHMRSVRDEALHNQLKHALIEHIWATQSGI